MAQKSTSSFPVRNRWHLIRKIVVITAGLVITLVVIGWIGFFVLLNGGLKQTWLDAQSQPDFNSAHFQNLRQQVDTTMNSEFTKVFSRFRYISSGYNDDCKKGQHNFEVKDPYAYICSRKLTRYYGFNGDFKQTMQALGGQLKSAGWAEYYSSSIEATLDSYYDTYYQGPGTEYTVKNLPAAVYTKEDYRMEFDWAEQGDTVQNDDLFANNLNDYDIGPAYNVNKNAPVASVAANILHNYRYAMSVSITKTYYEK